MEEGEPDPNDIFADLGMLIVEGRKPEDSIKGRREGDHCPSLIGLPLHQCIPGNARCHSMNLVRSHINHMFHNNIPMSIEVLQHPDCCQNSLEEVAVGAEASLTSEQPCILLEQWIIQELPRRSLQYQQSSRMLLQAIRSYLHFSQLSSWLSMNNGKEPKNITYRVSAPGEAFPANFVKTPEVHSFPAVNITKSSCIRVSVAYLPRQQQIPAVPCAVGHKKMKFTCPPSSENTVGNVTDTRFQAEHARQFKCKRGSGGCKCFDRRVKLERFNTDISMGHSSRQLEKNVHKLDQEIYQNAKKHKRKCNTPSNSSKKTNVHGLQQSKDEKLNEVVIKNQLSNSSSIADCKSTDIKNVSIPHVPDTTSPSVSSQKDSVSSKASNQLKGAVKSENSESQKLEERIDSGIYFVAGDEHEKHSSKVVHSQSASIIKPAKESIATDVQCASQNVHKHTKHSSTSVIHKQSTSTECTESSDTVHNKPMLQTSPLLRDFRGTKFITSVQILVSDIRTKLDFASDDEMLPSVSTISAIKQDKKSEVLDTHKPSMKRGNQASGQGFHSDPATAFNTVQEKTRQGNNNRFIPVFTKSKSLFKSVIQKEPPPTPKPSNENSFERSKGWSSPEPKRQHSRSIDSSGSYIFNPRTGLPLNSSPAPMRKTKESNDDSSLSSRHTVTLKSSTSCNDLGRTLTPMNQSTRILSTSAPASTSCLLGSFEESVLNGRMEPLGTIEGFSAEIGASGRFCPSHVKLPVTAFFYSVTDDDQPSSYMGYISLESVGKRGYHVPSQGTIQVTLFNPNGTVVKIFVVRYNLSDMPPNCQTFCRQRVFYMPSNADVNDDCEKELRYLLHLRFQSSKSGRIYLHTDIRMIFARHRPDLESGIATYELRSFTEMPSNPRFSPKK